ncbi:MAG: hypothetical protein N3G80_04180 [Candidatus Micrarchaeota archaeon]|nr:hypothetical protein [Candidatus Micrarchaeota archaeon]
MASKKRGRERLVTCAACGRTMPKDKAVKFSKVNVFSTELKTNEDVKATTFIESYYCISCGKHRKIFEKLKKRAALQASRNVNFRPPTDRWNSGPRW